MLSSCFQLLIMFTSFCFLGWHSLSLERKGMHSPSRTKKSWEVFFFIFKATFAPRG